jgi:hypothetical protein
MGGRRQNRNWNKWENGMGKVKRVEGGLKTRAYRAIKSEKESSESR